MRATPRPVNHHDRTGPTSRGAERGFARWHRAVRPRVRESPSPPRVRADPHAPTRPRLPQPNFWKSQRDRLVSVREPHLHSSRLRRARGQGLSPPGAGSSRGPPSARIASETPVPRPMAPRPPAPASEGGPGRARWSPLPRRRAAPFTGGPRPSLDRAAAHLA